MHFKGLRFYFALFVSKTGLKLMKLLGKNGTYFPGMVAIRLCPDFLGKIEKPSVIFCVTGTDGKTVSANLLNDILRDHGYDILCNTTGSNTNAGIATALLGASTYSGKPTKQIAVLETDERSSKKVYPYIHPTYILCTNIERDSVERNPHPQYICDFIDDAVPEGTKMILNSDDLCSMQLGGKHEHAYFAIAKMPSDRSEVINVTNDFRLCPHCNTPLKVEYARNHSIARAHCPDCGFGSPEPDYEARVDLGKRTMELQGITYPLQTDTLFYAYDELGVITALLEFGMPAEDILDSLGHIRLTKSRHMYKKIGDTTIIGNMMKDRNAVACSCNFDMVRNDRREKELIVILENMQKEKFTSENICWYGDTDFNFLNDPTIKRIIIAGHRAPDTKLFMMNAGVPEEKILTTYEYTDAASLLKLDTHCIYYLYDLYMYPQPALKLWHSIVGRVREENKR